ncbi:hypothetical protein C2S52_008422 [Perilla frutescens var. hirtella]|nr:hypothetical protein C2S52_008422 [Perilla frutescens var. hirtella]
MADKGSDNEEWDADLVDQLIRLEERALSTQTSRHPPPPPPQEPSRIQPPTQTSRILPPTELSYSPPRELSQRTHETYHTGGIPEFVDTFAPHGTDIAKERELSKLQKELNRVSKQLSHLEKDCSELRKERDKNLEQLKELNSRIEAKNAEVNLTKNMEMDVVVCSPSAPGISTTCQKAKPSKKQLGSWTKSCDTGRDKATEVSTSTLQETCCRSEKLFGLWNSNDQKQGRVLVAKLYKTCEEDFHVLIGCMNSPGNGSNMASSHQQCSFQPIEFEKVLHLYSVFTKISNDILLLEDLLEALVELCNLKNVFIVHWSLRVLRKILSNSSSMEKEFDERENVTVEEPISGNIEYGTNGRGNMEKENLCFVNVAEMLKQGQIPSALKFFNAKTPDVSGFSNHNFATSVPVVYLVSLFERICRIATENNDERVRCESLSIMNLILMRHNAYLERDKFAGELVFRSLSQLLRREAGFSVQDQAVHALYLLCNCPKVVATISSCLKEDGELVCSKDMNANSFPTFQELNEILIGLADCVACYGSATVEEMKLRRSAIFFLAFLGSSGKSGFEILLNHRLPKGTNFLAIILQSLSKDLDLQASKSAKRSGIVMEQSLVVREALILLNRLVSHPQYAIPVLKALTATRDTASMTVDVANRLTQKSNTTKQIRESEILELARVFKKRIFTYLEDNIS